MIKIQWKLNQIQRAPIKSYTPRSGIQDSSLVFLPVPSGSGDPPDSSSSAACGFHVKMVPICLHLPKMPYVPDVYTILRSPLH